MLRARALVLAVFAASVSLGAALGQEAAPRLEVHRKGEVGAFRLALPDAWVGRDAGAALLSKDGAAYLIWRTGPAAFVGRFQGAGRHELVLVTHDAAGARAERPIAVDFPAADADQPDVLAAWASAGAAAIEAALGSNGGGRRDSFLSFLAWSWRTRFGAPDEQGSADWSATFREREAPDLLSVATGLYAVQESLQLAALANPTVLSGEATEPIASLRGPEIASHPFRDMLEGRAPPPADGREHRFRDTLRHFLPRPRLRPVPDALAAWVPADRYYVRIRGIDRLAALVATADTWLTHFGRTVEEASLDARVFARTLGALGLGEDALARPELVGAAKEIALFGPDPFFREGTAIGAIIEANDPAALDAAIEARWTAALGRVPGAQAVVREVGPERVRVRGVTAPDGALSAWRFVDGSRLVLAGSLRLVEEVLAARAGRVRPLAAADDFLYMRALLPADEHEDAFVYLSDAHIRSLVSPEMKLQERRRLTCASAIQAVSNAADVFRMELRRPPRDIEEVVSAGFLPGHMLRCPDGGAYALEGGTGLARCSIHGRLGALVPLGDLPRLERVTPREKEEYERFVEDYSRYWRQYFDPIGARLSLAGGVTIDTIILPLIENSVYRTIVDATGGGTFSAGTVLSPRRTVFSIQAALAPEKKREALSALAREAGLSQADAVRAIGDDVALGLYDSELLFDFDVHEFLSFPFRNRNGAGMLAAMPLLTALDMPTYVSVPVRDEPALERLLAAMRRRLGEVDARAAGRRAGGGVQEVGFDIYDLPAYRGTAVHVVGLKILDLVKWRIFYATVRGRLYAASRREVLRDVIDLAEGGPLSEASAGPAPAAPAGPTGTATLRLALDPTAVDRMRPDVYLSWAEHARRACMNNVPGIWGAVLASGGRDLAAALGTGIARRGVTFFCPDLGDYRVDPETGAVRCSLHGAPGRGTQLLVPRALPGARPLLERLGPARVDLTLSPEGLRVRIRIEAR